MNANAPDGLTPAATKVYGVAIILAPLLLLASTIAYVAVGEGINHGVLGGTIGVWSYFALAIAFVGILRVVEARAPRAAPALTVLAVTGFAAGVAFNVEAIFLATSGQDLLLGIVEGAVEGPEAIAILAFLPWGWFAPVTFVATGVLLWRIRAASPWQGALLVAGGVLFVASRPEQIDVLALIADGVLVLALLPIGWAMLTRAPASATVEAARPAVTG